MWPPVVHASEVQSRLLHEGVPVERAMQMTSELRNVRPGFGYRIELPGKVLVLHGTTAPEWFDVTQES